MNDKARSPQPQTPDPGPHARFGYLVLAYTATAFGLAGVLLPLLPATPFLLVAAWAAMRGSPRVHDWIYAQPLFARLLNDWQQQGAVPLGAKWLTTAMMIASLSFLVWRGYHWVLVLAMCLFFIGIGIFLWTRPRPGH